MKLPLKNHAVIPREKIVDYLLSFSHHTGRWKAMFFTEFGFTVDLWDDFAIALFQHANNNDVIRIKETVYGTKYIIEGIIETPDGRNPLIRAIWFVKENNTYPVFITAYPFNGGKNGRI
ncbi:MAG: hypothetical protein P9X24_11480 [Candidatus Hatepunaea meridiana]|nr:hypothetical protein [Candidatus Hatepunaea meridiana]